jgi:hypothetical protein
VQRRLKIVLVVILILVAVVVVGAVKMFGPRAFLGPRTRALTARRSRRGWMGPGSSFPTPICRAA